MKKLYSILMLFAFVFAFPTAAGSALALEDGNSHFENLNDRIGNMQIDDQLAVDELFIMTKQAFDVDLTLRQAQDEAGSNRFDKLFRNADAAYESRYKKRLNALKQKIETYLINSKNLGKNLAMYRPDYSLRLKAINRIEAALSASFSS